MDPRADGAPGFLTGMGKGQLAVTYKQINSLMLGTVPVDGAEEWVAQFPGFVRTH